MSAPDEAAAHVHVVRGAPDDVELAALVAGLVASSSADGPEVPHQADEWTSRLRSVRNPPAPAPGRDTWRWSLHP